jgi:hypothetical protein
MLLQDDGSDDSFDEWRNCFLGLETLFLLNLMNSIIPKKGNG